MAGSLPERTVALAWPIRTRRDLESAFASPLLHPGPPGSKLFAVTEGSGKIELRPMAAWDLDEVARIEQETFGDPWPRETFADCLELADACWVAQTEEGLEGYGIILIHPGQAHIANLCVRTTARGRGVGRLLLKRLLEAASEQGVEHISLEVRTSNERAIRLYQSAGFEPSGLRSGYYPGGEDALVMVLRCASTRLEEGAE